MVCEELKASFMEKQDIDIKEIRELAKRFTPEEDRNLYTTAASGRNKYLRGVRTYRARDRRTGKGRVRQRINGQRHIPYRCSS